MAVNTQEFTESKPKEQKWNYEHFREFLISQARGENFLLPLEKFPQEIELTNDWHAILNQMRDQTAKDEIERVGLVGYNLERRGIFLPKEKIVSIPWSFERRKHVPHLAIEIQKSLAISKDIKGFVGILHSHPPDMGRPRLSAGDLHIALTEGYGPMIGVADGDINSFAFRTRESTIPSISQPEFYDLWEGEPRLPEVDIKISEQYKLALYRAAKNGNLQRAYPYIDRPQNGFKEKSGLFSLFGKKHQ